MIRRHRRSGVIVPIIVAAIAIFMAVLTIIVDGGMMLVAHGELVGIAEAAALSEAAAGPAPATAAAEARRFLDANGLSAVTCTVVADGTHVEVVLRREVRLLLSRRPGSSEVEVRGAAAAVREGGRLRLLP